MADVERGRDVAVHLRRKRRGQVRASGQPKVWSLALALEFVSLLGAHGVRDAPAPCEWHAACHVNQGGQDQREVKGASSDWKMNVCV